MLWNRGVAGSEREPVMAWPSRAQWMLWNGGVAGSEREPVMAWPSRAAVEALYTAGGQNVAVQ